jgi:aryl-alcohol dehydrogenase-like predicted oxidoreductase
LALLDEKVWPAGEKEGLSKTGLAMSYLLSFPEISTVIPGIRTPEQVLANTDGLKALSAGTKELLQSLASEWEAVVQLMELRG